jgi:hypothetical protein
MPVVINDFEIVSDQAGPAASSQPAATGQAEPPAARPLSPLEVEQVLRYHAKRLARVAAS